MIDRVDLGDGDGVEWGAGRKRTAIVLPGALLGGAPSTYYAALTLFEAGWRVIQVLEQWDRETERLAWATARADAALAYAGGAELVVAKSLTSQLTGWAAGRALRGIWLTPLLVDEATVDGLRRRTAPALLIGGTDDPMWAPDVAREVGDEILELEGADHGLARIADLPLIVDAIRRFAA